MNEFVKFKIYCLCGSDKVDFRMFCTDCDCCGINEKYELRCNSCGVEESS